MGEPLREAYERPILLIGYGNTLRGDDAVGYEVAATIATWQRPWVRSQAVHQLLPELAAAIAEVSTVIFIDAALSGDPPTAGISLEPLTVEDVAPFRAHQVTPSFLLGLAQRLYGSVPRAFLLTIPAAAFNVGTPLSPLAMQGKDSALAYLDAVL